MLNQLFVDYLSQFNIVSPSFQKFISSLLVFDRGKIGMGTNDPKERLDVNGLIVMRGQASDSSASALLDTLPNYSLIIGGVESAEYGVGRIKFYCKDNVAKYMFELRSIGTM